MKTQLAMGTLTHLCNTFHIEFLINYYLTIYKIRINVFHL